MMIPIHLHQFHWLKRQRYYSLHILSEYKDSKWFVSNTSYQYVIFTLENIWKLRKLQNMKKTDFRFLKKQYRQFSDGKQLKYKKAVLSQGEPRDAAVNVDTHIQVFSGIARFSLRQHDFCI